MAIAQNGILRRRLAASTYTGSGLGGGGAAGAGAAVRAGGPDAAGAAAGVVVAGVVAGAFELAAASLGASARRRRPGRSRSAAPRPLQEMFGDLGHFADDRWPSPRSGNLSTGSIAMHFRTTWRARETCVPDFAHLALTTTVRWRMSRLVGGRSVPPIAAVVRAPHTDRPRQDFRTHDRNRPTRVARDEPGLPDGAHRDPRAVARDHSLRQAPPGRGSVLVG